MHLLFSLWGFIGSRCADRLGELGRDDEEKLDFRHLENVFLGSLVEHLEGKES